MAAIGSSTKPVYVNENGQVTACNIDNDVVLAAEQGPTGGYDTSTSAINNINILHERSTTVVINIQRLLKGVVYKFMFLSGSNSGEVYLCNGNGNNFTFNSGPTNYTTKKALLNGGSHGSSYTSHVIRYDNTTVYQIWGY
jgi:hypothetical protein